MQELRALSALPADAHIDQSDSLENFKYFKLLNKKKKGQIDELEDPKFFSEPIISTFRADNKATGSSDTSASERSLRCSKDTEVLPFPISELFPERAGQPADCAPKLASIGRELESSKSLPTTLKCDKFFDHSGVLPGNFGDFSNAPTERSRETCNMHDLCHENVEKNAREKIEVNSPRVCHSYCSMDTAFEEDIPSLRATIVFPNDSMDLGSA